MIRLVPSLIILARVPCEEDIRAKLPDPAHQIFDDRFAVFKFEKSIIVAEIDVLLSRNPKFCQSRQFLLAANPSELSS